MKIIVSLSAGLLFGFSAGAGLGWYFGYTRPVNSANRDAKHYIQTVEMDDSTAAIFALGAIPRVESGDRQKAVAWLAKPIGAYYRVYAHNAGTNEERIALRKKIEQLASTNDVVAAEIAKRLQ